MNASSSLPSIAGQTILNYGPVGPFVTRRMLFLTHSSVDLPGGAGTVVAPRTSWWAYNSDPFPDRGPKRGILGELGEGTVRMLDTAGISVLTFPLETYHAPFA